MSTEEPPNTQVPPARVWGHTLPNRKDIESEAEEEDDKGDPGKDLRLSSCRLLSPFTLPVSEQDRPPLTIISEVLLPVKRKTCENEHDASPQSVKRAESRQSREPRAGVHVDVPLLIRQRLSELGLDQKDLAAAVQVTESYISQLLARKKAPPAPGRTDLYEKIGQFLRLPSGELGRLADMQRKDDLKKKIEASPAPLFKECRDLILRKCEPERRSEVRRIFEKETFGELERLITQKVLDVAQELAREELRSEEWLRLMAQLSQRSYEQMRVA